MELFACLVSEICSSLEVDTELSFRIGKASSAMARLSKKVWDNSKLTIKTNHGVPSLCAEYSAVRLRALDSVLTPKAQAQHILFVISQENSWHLLAEPHTQQRGLSEGWKNQHVFHAYKATLALVQPCGKHARLPKTSCLASLPLALDRQKKKERRREKT